MSTTTSPPSVGAELRRWREQRSLSQLALAGRAEVSTRHLSCVETGRSRPTSSMIVRLAEVLEVPMAEQNALLLAGGFAPRYPQRPADGPELAPVMDGLRRLLDAHAPFPALLLDDHWDVVDANAAVDGLLVGCAPELLEPPLNVIRLCLHPGGLAPRIRNLPTWRAHLRGQLDERIVRSGGDPGLLALQEEAEALSPGAWQDPPPRPDPVVLLELEAGGLLRLFSVATRIENPQDVTLGGLHLDLRPRRRGDPRGALGLSGPRAVRPSGRRRSRVLGAGPRCPG